MIIHEMEQRSDEWFAVKLGKFSATDMTTIANGRADTLKKLVYKKAAEIITGHRVESFTNHHMERGVELEDDARELYEFITGNTVRQVGFVEVDGYFGVSPDGLIGNDGGVEIKCKDDHTHLNCLINGDNSYKWQIQGSLYATGREWWDFAYYNPNFPAEKQLYIKRWYPDDESFEKIEAGLDKAVSMLKELLEAINERPF